MPVVPCQKGGKPGFKFGESGACFTYTPGDSASRDAAREKAIAQGVASGELKVGLDLNRMMLGGGMLPAGPLLAAGSGHRPEDRRRKRRQRRRTLSDDPMESQKP